jgi:hypothetical protein
VARLKPKEKTMKARKAAFIAFGYFIALSAAYVAWRITIEMGLGIGWAVPISAVVFAFAVLLIDRASPN